MQVKFSILFFVFFHFTIQLQAQTSNYPKNYFRDPLGIPMKLVANFGELRPNHWHMGLDIRTEQKVNRPVFAAANGYIAHAGIRPESFGRFIIVNHPDGHSTLYAHLNKFFPELQKYAEEQQYSEESWEIELDFLKNKFPVTKGQLIALSGSTGSSEGPHLHFEIRDTKSGKCLNPLLFGFPIKDDVPPTILKLAVYDRSRGLYDQSPVLFQLKNSDSGYAIYKGPGIKTGLRKLSFAVQAVDKMTGSDNPNGIYSAKVYFDGRAVSGFLLDSISYSTTAYVNAQVDYPYRFDGGVFLQHLSPLPGDQSGVYRIYQGDGMIHLTDTVFHHVRIEIKDAAGNTSSLNFPIKYSDSLASLLTPVPVHSRLSFLTNQLNTFVKPDFEAIIPVNALYDSLQPIYLRTNANASNAVSAIHQLNNASVPLHSAMIIRIKPDRFIPDVRKDKVVIQRSYREGVTVKKAKWEIDPATSNSWMTASFGDFGSFAAYIDTLPPTLNELGAGDTVDLSPAKLIAFRPTDNFGMIKSFRAELDNKWLCFTNDKGKIWIYEFDEHCPFGTHKLKVSVEDLVGNRTIKTWWFKRFPYTPPKKTKKTTKGKKKA